MAINIVNKHTHNSSDYIYCGRGSPLGNPFMMYNENQRDYVCDLYEKYFEEQVKLGDAPFMAQLNLIEVMHRRGDTVNLGCFCAPKRCHCETIKTYIENKVRTYE